MNEADKQARNIDVIHRTPDSTSDTIRESFRTRSTTYYADNYTGDANAPRVHRLRRVEQALRGCIQPGALVLDAGAGPAVLGETVNNIGGRYIASDLSFHNLVSGRERLGELVGAVGDLRAIPFAGNTFDTVVAMGCLEYVPAVELALAELARVVKPGGYVIASFANSASPARWWDERFIRTLRKILKGKKGGVSYPRYLHSAKMIRGLLGQGGVTVQSLEYLGGGLLGYPFYTIAALASAERALGNTISASKPLSSEFLIVGKKADEQ